MAEPKAAAPDKASNAAASPRALARLRPILSYVGFALLIALPVVSIVQMYLNANAPPPKPGPEKSLAALETGDFDRAEELAKKLGNSDKSKAAKELIAGMKLSDRAGYKGPKEQKELAQKALEHLKTAQELGLPDGWETRVKLLQAKNFFRAKRFAESRPLLEEVAAHGGPEANEARAMLSVAWRRGKQPDLKKAIQWNAELLAERGLSTAEKDAALLEHAELKLISSEIGAASEALSQLSADGQTRDEAIVLRARVLMAEAQGLAAGEKLSDAERDKYKSVVEQLRKLMNRSDPDDPISGDAAFLTAVCRLRLGEVPQALGLLERTHRIYLGQYSAQSASLLAANWRIRRDEDAQAVATLREEFAAFPPAETFEHPTISLSALRDELASDYQRLIAKRNFEQAVALAQAVVNVLEPARAVDLEAQAQTEWSNALLERASALPNEQRIKLVRAARRERRRAGDAQLKLADLQKLTQDYAKHLWDAVESYRVAQSHSNVIRALHLYFTAEVKRHRPTGLHYLGEALLATRDTEGALRVLGECIEEFPKADSALSARLISARALRHKGDLEAAEKLLNDNLYSVGIAPASIEWRDSLFELGRLKYSQGRYAEAIKNLEEAAERYEPMPEAIESRYLAAESYRKLANSEKPPTELPVDRPTCLARAVENYDAALAQLDDHYSSSQDPRVRESLTRNCRFGKGDALLKLHRIDEASEIFRNLVADYAASPESLPAYVQLANCKARRGEYEEAENVLKQAKVNIAYLDMDESEFQRLTFFKREEWSESLDKQIAARKQDGARAISAEGDLPNRSVP